MAGHLFITHGDLLHLHCDAILIPSSTHPGKKQKTGYLKHDWVNLGLEVDRDGCLFDPPDDNRRLVRARAASKASPAVWVAHSSGPKNDGDWHTRPIREFIRSHKSRKRSPVPRPLGDDRLLLGIPLIGASAEARADAKGEVMKSAVQRILTELETTDVDVAFVLVSGASYAAAQEARSRYRHGRSGLSAAEGAVVDALADSALMGRLVLFLGAGVSIGAGLPSWGDLLEGLARRAGLSPAELKELNKLDHRDAGEILAKRLGPDTLRAAIAEVIGGRQGHVSLLHQLLASVPVNEALTTNYDTMFEDAWRDAGRSPAVLPARPRRTAHEWLVKLHGSIDDKRRPLVLSRGDYLRFETSSSALAGIVHAMLLTRELLFVGYSLSDDNFHRIVHQVRETVAATRDVRDGSNRFGTVLTDQPSRLVEDLWEGDLDFVSTAANRRTGSIRQMAVILDALAARTAGHAAHLMNPSFDGVFNDAERAVRDLLREVGTAAGAEKVRPGIRQTVEQMLEAFGG